MNRYILKEEIDTETKNFISVLRKIKAFNNMASRGELKNNDQNLSMAHDLIKQYRKYNTDAAESYLERNNISAEDHLKLFANSLYNIFPEKYESEFNPIFSKAQIFPQKENKPSVPTSPDKEEAKKEDKPSVPTSPDEKGLEYDEDIGDKPADKTKPEAGKKTDYHGSSIVDYLEMIGEPSDFASRKIRAQKMGIPDYRGTASQNLLMLSALKGGKTEVPSKRAEFSKAAPSPQINFGGSKQDAYVDMGGGRYAPATEDQLGDSKVQLYVKNPKKGQGEYLKPNYIKVRREGSDLRPQSQFGGALGSASNLFGDIGNTLAKPFR
jgi:hypothetical protein